MGLRSRIGWLWAAVLLALPSVAAAQERAIGRPHASVLTVSTSASLMQTGETGPATIFQRATSVGPRSNYWLEGAIAGGVLMGTATALFAYHLCKDPDSYTGDGNCGLMALLGALPGATVGGVIGAFVGKTIHKGGGTAATSP